MHVVGPEQGLTPARHADRLRRQPYLHARRASARSPSASARPKSRTCSPRRRCGSASRRRCASGRRARSRAASSAKDVILAIIARIGAAGAAGHAIEYAGSTIRALSMEGRLTVCNMSIEAGARAGMIAPDDTTFAYLAGRPYAPQGAEWDAARRALARAADRCGRDLRPRGRARRTRASSRWSRGATSPEDALPISGRVPDPSHSADAERREAMQRALRYMGLDAGHAARPTSRSTACSSARARTRASRTCAARRGRCGGRKVAAEASRPGWCRARGSSRRRRRPRASIACSSDAGFQWRFAGCSMCLGTNGDQVAPGPALRVDVEPQLRRSPGPGRRART